MKTLLSYAVGGITAAAFYHVSGSLTIAFLAGIAAPPALQLAGAIGRYKRWI